MLPDVGISAKLSPGEHRVPAHRVVETATERLLLTFRLHADDFGMPRRLVFEWDRFAKTGGRWLGRATKSGKRFDKDVQSSDTGVVAEVAAFAKTLAR